MTKPWEYPFGLPGVFPSACTIPRSDGLHLLCGLCLCGGLSGALDSLDRRAAGRVSEFGAGPPLLVDIMGEEELEEEGEVRCVHEQSERRVDEAHIARLLARVVDDGGDGHRYPHDHLE